MGLRLAALKGGLSLIAKVAVSAAVFAIDKPYDYWAPEALQLAPGMRVKLPFGKGNRVCEGMVCLLYTSAQRPAGTCYPYKDCVKKENGKGFPLSGQQ